MKIKIKYIEHERIQDAPFIGALVCAINCNINCKECFNQVLKHYETIKLESLEIINEIKANNFNEGIILGGLEWTEQPKEMIELINLSLKYRLQVMVYTGLELEEFINKFPYLKNKNIYLKFGRYISELKVENKFKYDVKIASKNQDIVIL